MQDTTLEQRTFDFGVLEEVLLLVRLLNLKVKCKQRAPRDPSELN